MAKIYIHQWRDDNGNTFIQEHEIITTLEECEQAYYEQLANGFEYWATIMIGVDKSESIIFDIEQEIRDQREYDEIEEYTEAEHQRIELDRLRRFQ